MNSILIEKGEVYDPTVGSIVKKNIEIENGKIVETGTLKEPEVVVDATGCLVVPGLIDFHLHLFSDGCDGGVDVDAACLPNGVTTAVDGGSCGESNYEIFHKYNIVRSTVRVKSCLNVSSAGLASTRFNENLDPAAFSAEKIKHLYEKYPDELTALKIRASKGLIAEGDTGPIKACLEIAEEIGCGVVVHTTNPALSSETIADMLRPGDVFCHAFQGTGDTILDGKGSIKQKVRAARERGVVFDACHGRVNFTLKTARAAMAQGFLPDIISTDMSPKTLYRQPVISLPSLMSKLLALGASLEQVLDMVTLNPAKLLGAADELASLRPSTVADIAVLRIADNETVFFDFLGESVKGRKLILPRMTIAGGRIVYRATDFV